MRGKESLKFSLHQLYGRKTARDTSAFASLTPRGKILDRGYALRTSSSIRFEAQCLMSSRAFIPKLLMATSLVKLPEVERLSPLVIRILGGNPGKV